MSAINPNFQGGGFGYGSTYAPSWRNQSNPEPGTAQAIAPAMGMPNWNPNAKSPWADPMLHNVGTYAGRQQGDYQVRDPWANPLASLFGDLAGPNTQDIPAALMQQYMTPVNAYAAQPNYDGQQILDMGRDLMGTPGTQVRKNNNLPGPVQINTQLDQQGLAGALPGYQATPQNTKQLFDSIGGLKQDQLMRLSGNGGIGQKFGQVAQDYKNAYANPNYGKSLWGQNSQYGGNNLSEGQTMDYLQQSYNKLLSRMNDNFLL